MFWLHSFFLTARFFRCFPSFLRVWKIRPRLYFDSFWPSKQELGTFEDTMHSFPWLILYAFLLSVRLCCSTDCRSYMRWCVSVLDFVVPMTSACRSLTAVHFTYCLLGDGFLLCRLSLPGVDKARNVYREVLVHKHQQNQPVATSGWSNSIEYA